MHEVRYHSGCVTRPLAETGLTQKLFAANWNNDKIKSFMAQLLKLARNQPVKMRRSQPLGKRASKAYGPP